MPAACCIVGCPPGGGTNGPPDPGDLAVSAAADPDSLLEGGDVVLSATATGGTPPYAFRWDQNAGPVDLDLTGVDVTNATTTVTNLAEPGRYVFRVVVTDSEGRSRSAFVEVIVEQGVGVTASADAQSVLEGERATLSATTERGFQPFSFVWRQLDGPADLTLEDATGDTLRTPLFPEVGLYTFEVMVTDSEGYEDSASVDINVQSAVAISDPGLAIAGEPVQLTATVLGDAADGAFMWTVLEGSAGFDDAALKNPMVTTDLDETITLQLTITVTANDGSSVDVTREVQVTSITGMAPRVLIETNLGDFTIELDSEIAPLHTANFLFYVDTDFYVDVLFHRVVVIPEPFVIQAGGYTREDGEQVFKEPTRDPVISESAGQASLGLYDVALALSGGNPNSGSTQFFISLVDDNGFPGVEGFTVFGLVVDGTETIDAIAAVEVEANPFAPSGEVSLPVEDVIILNASRLLP